MSAPATPCPGCGLVLAAHDGPRHPYIGASAACWALCGELLARAAEHAPAPPALRLVVDTYAVQHPGIEEPRAVRSVALHLMVLCLALERSLEPEHATDAIRRLIGARLPLRWLEPPWPNGAVTVCDVLDAAWPHEAGARAQAWARDVWGAWAAHHATVRGWLDRAGW